MIWKCRSHGHVIFHLIQELYTPLLQHMSSFTTSTFNRTDLCSDMVLRMKLKNVMKALTECEDGVSCSSLHRRVISNTHTHSLGLGGWLRYPGSITTLVSPFPSVPTLPSSLSHTHCSDRQNKKLLHSACGSEWVCWGVSESPQPEALWGRWAWE
jgi:hypothetical protein